MSPMAIKLSILQAFIHQLGMPACAFRHTLFGVGACLRRNVLTPPSSFKHLEPQAELADGLAGNQSEFELATNTLLQTLSSSLSL